MYVHISFEGVPISSTEPWVRFKYLHFDLNNWKKLQVLWATLKPEITFMQIFHSQLSTYNSILGFDGKIVRYMWLIHKINS
jgi:hypothetical protein